MVECWVPLAEVVAVIEGRRIQSDEIKPQANTLKVVAVAR